jgi:hypothetical protein
LGIHSLSHLLELLLLRVLLLLKLIGILLTDQVLNLLPLLILLVVHGLRNALEAGDTTHHCLSVAHLLLLLLLRHELLNQHLLL